jgi:anti-sigma B factor antagonist
MRIHSREIEGAVILDFNGRLVLGEDTVLLRERVRALIAEGQKKILLNLQDVPYIDSSGLGELVTAFMAVRKEGGDLKLLKLTPKVHGLLQITKLYTVFEVYDDEEAALRSYLRNSGTRNSGTDGTFPRAHEPREADLS